MTAITKICLLIVGCAIMLMGCENTELFREEPDLAPELSEPENIINSSRENGANARNTAITLSGFQVHYDGQTFDGSKTTFTYTVTGPAADMHFRLELPGCAPANPIFSPTNGNSNNNDPLINPGVEWHPPVGSGSTNSFTFRVTYTGFVKEGVVLVSVKNNNTTELGEIPGACARVFDISGKVYTDANDNALLDNNETGIANARVNLLDGSGNLLTSMLTNSSGGYLFECFPQGNYSLSIDTNSVVSTATTYIEVIPPVTINISLGPDAVNNNFGFKPKTTKLIDALKLNELLTNGESAKFWSSQFKVALSGKGKAQISKADLIQFVAQIRTLQLPEVYALPGGDGLQAAFDILSMKPGNSDEDKLRIQLLATELNHVSGRGIIGTDPELQLVLLGWGESLIFEIDNPGAANGRQSSATSRTISSLGSAASLFELINKSSGGGGSGI